MTLEGGREEAGAFGILLGAEFIDPALGLGAEGAGAGLASGFFVVKEGGRSLTFFTVEFGDVKGTLDVAGSELTDLTLGELGLLAVGVAEEEVIEGLFGAVEVGAVLVSIFGFGEKNGPDAVLGFGGVLRVWVVARELAVSGDGAGGAGGSGSSAFVNLSDGKLSFVR